MATRLSAVCRGAVMAAIRAEAPPTIGLSVPWIATARYAVVCDREVKGVLIEQVS